MSAWSDHVAKWKDCDKCPLCRQRFRICLARGDVPCDVVIVGEAPGASEDATGLPFCIGENHRVLMSDLTWKPLGDIQVGDMIIAPDEYGSDVDTGSASGRDARRWRLATVTNVRRSQQQCVKLVTEQGSLTITPDHRVLTAYPTCCKARRWLRVDQLKVERHRSSCLATVFPPWVKDESYKSGWVGGFLDGEGNVPKDTTRRRKVRLGFSQNSGPTCEQAKQYIKDLGYECSKDYTSETGNERILVLGGFRKIIELLGRTRPERLIRNFTNWIDASAPRCYSVQPSKVVEINNRTRAPQNVVDITTTTGTFICEGFIVHNCGPAGDLLQQVVDQALGPLAACSTCGALRYRDGEEQTCKNGHLRRDGHGGRIVYYAMTNLVCCYPREAKQRGDNEPERAEIDACRPRLVEFVNIARPRLIVCVGRLATDSVDHLDTVRCADIVHPAHVLRKDVPQAQKQSIMHRAVVVLRNAVAAALDSVGTDFQEWGTRRANLKTGRDRIQAAYDDAELPF